MPRKQRTFSSPPIRPSSEASSSTPATPLSWKFATSQLADLAEAAETLGHHARAREKMRECLDVASDMIRRDASVKNYISKYDKILALAKRLDVPTHLQ